MISLMTANLLTVTSSLSFYCTALTSGLGTTTTVSSGGLYYLRSKHSGHYLDAEMAYNNNVIQYEHHGNPNQVWKITSVGGGYYTLEVLEPYYQGSGRKMLSVNQYSHNVDLYYQTSGLNTQQWKIVSNGDGSVRLINRWGENDNQTLDVANASLDSTANVQTYRWSGHNCQRWYLELVKAPGSDPYDLGWYWVFDNVRKTKNISAGYKLASRPDHYAIDLSGNAGYAINGTSIYSPTSGKVVYRWQNNASIGNGVLLETNNVDPGTGKKIRVRFIHMMEAPPVSVGETVTVNTVLGRVGSTGNSSGPHLDLAMTKDGSTGVTVNGAINPQRFYRYIPFTGQTSTAL